MPLILPLNKLGKRADPDNEAHMMGVMRKGLRLYYADCAVNPSVEKHAALFVRTKELRDEQSKAMDRAALGDFKWRTAIEAGGKNILDYWDGSKVVWHPLIEHSNPSSKESFLYYLGHSIPDVMQAGYEDWHEQLRLVIAEGDVDEFWLFNTLEELGL